VIDFANAKFCGVVFSVFSTFWHHHGFAEVAWWRTGQLTALLIRLHFLRFDAWWRCWFSCVFIKSYLIYSML